MATDPAKPEAALDALPAGPGREALRQTVLAASFRGVLPYEEAKRLAAEEGLSMEAFMLLLVGVAAAYANPAISEFPVGAVAQGSTTGSLYFGANMEFPGGALSFTTHAEQAATTNAWNNGEQGLTLLAVSEPPCGYCRQFLYEITTAAKLTILLKADQPTLLTNLLPHAFGPENLGNQTPLMTPMSNGLSLDTPSSDAVALAALGAANACYAPYTKDFAGAAVQTASGDIYSGRLGENAAYNPSISPLESTLVMWDLATIRTDPVVRVVLVQVDGAVADQTTATETLVESLRREAELRFEVLGAHH